MEANVAVEEGRFISNKIETRYIFLKKRENRQPLVISPLLKQPGWAFILRTQFCAIAVVRL